MNLVNIQKKNLKYNFKEFLRKLKSFKSTNKFGKSLKNIKNKF